MTDTTKFINAVVKEAGDARIMIGDVFIQKCRDGYYHDFKSPLTFPKSQLATDLRAMGLKETAARVEKGEFDE